MLSQADKVAILYAPSVQFTMRRIPGIPINAHDTHSACAPPINMTTPTNLYFFAQFYKKGPAGSEKQVINLVWPNIDIGRRLSVIN